MTAMRLSYSNRTLLVSSNASFTSATAFLGTVSSDIACSNSIADLCCFSELVGVDGDGGFECCLLKLLGCDQDWLVADAVSSPGSTR